MDEAVNNPTLATEVERTRGEVTEIRCRSPLPVQWLALLYLAGVSAIVSWYVATR